MIYLKKTWKMSALQQSIISISNIKIDPDGASDSDYS